jgi:hypothetical protein
MARYPHPSWQRRHQAVLDWLLQNPAKKLYVCAEETGYSPTHISRIVNAPEFKRRYQLALDRKAHEASMQAILRSARPQD